VGFRQQIYLYSWYILTNRRMLYTSCPVCGSQEIPVVLEAEDHLVSRETFKISECNSCKLRFTNPRPDSEDLGKYYKSEDYVSHTNQGNNIINRAYKIARYFTLRGKEKLIRKASSTRTLLDIGCGTGQFLEHSKNNGWKINGVEIDPAARALASQTTQTEIYDKLESIDRKEFQVITLWHVLEHLPDLAKSITEIKNLLAKNGSLFIAVPNYLSYEAKKFGQHWAAYDVPRHLYHFSPQSMQTLAKNNGLKIVKTIPMRLDSYYISLLSNKQHLGKNHFINSFITGLLSNIYAKKSNNYSSLIYQIQKSDQ
jgi:2-polyprenyl-3-methyl-5-hydroxy-6-metoxy-1,4-benzoquinol methylase